MLQRTFPATVDALEDVNAWVEEALEQADASPKATMQILISLEEIFVNIAHYAYPGSQGTADLALTVENGKCTIRFEDSGIPFDPLAREDPNVTLSAQDRSVGGLGIYMVKNSMDSVTYAYQNNKNVLTIEKAI